MFAAFIALIKILATLLKLERFNGLVYLCAIVLNTKSDVDAFIQKYDHISNTLV